MKKFRAQISIGIICALLGFMITYQLRMVNKQSAAITEVNKNAPEIIIENEQLKKQIEEMKKKVSELDAKKVEYENAASGINQQTELLYKQLKETRTLIGATEVKGPGIIIYIDPKKDVFDSNGGQQRINDADLVGLVNELKAVGAEAISINELRYTSRTGIRNAGNAIIINGEKVSYSNRVTIKAIGRTDLLESAITFEGSISQDFAQRCKVTMEKSDEIIIPKYSKIYEFEFAKPIEKSEK